MPPVTVTASLVVITTPNVVLPQIFFLALMVITLIPDVSPVTPVTTVMPVLFVLAVAGIREAFEDIQRRKADNVVNGQLFDVSQDGRPVAPTKSEAIRVGDILLLHNNQRVPADLVVLKTSLPDGLCYVETSQLDGETNLKPYHAPVYTADMTVSEVLALRGTIISEKPCNNLKSFQSRIIVEQDPPSIMSDAAPPRRNVVVPLSETSLLLQGASLRNTDYVYGVVVFTGRHTKLSLNQRQPPSKFSRSDVILNKFVLALFILILIIVAIASLSAGLMSRGSLPHWYLFGGISSPSPAKEAIKMLFSYTVVAGYLIPMSIVVTLELSRFFQATMISYDSKMMHPVEEFDGSTTIQGALAKTSNLNDELSLVKYVFSDKTGTLTENKMVFHQSFVNGRLFTDPMHGDMLEYLSSDTITPAVAQPLEDFLLCLALCNSVVPKREDATDTDKDADKPRRHRGLGTIGSMHPHFRHDRTSSPKNSLTASNTSTTTTTTTTAGTTAETTEPKEKAKYSFNAQSPDESALCLAAQANSFTFVERTQKYLVVEYPDGRLVKFFVIGSIDFTSERRRMSVLLRKEDGTVVLYTKGADNVMFDLLAPNQSNPTLIDDAKEQLVQFSRVGLRALVVAMRVLPESMLMDWTGRYDEACSIVGDRDAAVRALFEEIEKGMTLLGCTAVEDKLQEGVPEAIHSLLRAGIQVWMITGDKQETAINISKSCRLVRENAHLVIVNSLRENDSDAAMKQAVADAQRYRDAATRGEDNAGIALVVSGQSTQVAVSKHADLFMQLVSLVDSVVCAQVTPLQKAQIVHCVKSNTDAICLAIGDGANDVSMIQTADVGVGIFGREGTQAARASDYAIRQFRDLVRLITVHGRYAMVRNSSCIKYCFYKNVSFIFVQYFFSAYTRFSGQTIYDDWVLTFFNIFLTQVPPLFLAFFEKDIPEDMITQYPELNRVMIANSYMRIRDLILWIVYGIYQSFVVFYTMYGIAVPGGGSSGILDTKGRTFDMSQLSAYYTMAALATVDIVMILHTRHWVFWTFGAMVFSVLFYLIEWIVQSYFPSLGSVLALSFGTVNTQPMYFLAVIFAVVTAVTPSLILSFVNQQFRPSMVQICNELSRVRASQEKTPLQETSEEHTPPSNGVEMSPL